MDMKSCARSCSSMSRNTSETDGHIQASNLCSGAWDDDLSCFLSGVSALKLCFAFVLLFTISSSCKGNESRSLGTSGFSGDTEASWQQNFLNARMQRSSKSEAAGVYYRRIQRNPTIKFMGGIPAVVRQCQYKRRWTAACVCVCLGGPWQVGLMHGHDMGI